MEKIKVAFLLVLFGLCVSDAHSITGSFHQIDTCYHWLDQNQLQAKLDYANAHSGELYFYEGIPIYCWRSPVGAYSKWEWHGEELIRIKFKSNVRVKLIKDKIKFYNTDFQNKYPAIYFHEWNYQEYLISPSAVESWSVYQPRMVDEINSELKYYKNDTPAQDDLFYPFIYFDYNYIFEHMQEVIKNIAAHSGESKIYGGLPEEHFQSSAHDLPWQKYIKNKKVTLPE